MNFLRGGTGFSSSVIKAACRWSVSSFSRFPKRTILKPRTPAIFIPLLTADEISPVVFRSPFQVYFISDTGLCWCRHRDAMRRIEQIIMCGANNVGRHSKMKCATMACPEPPDLLLGNIVLLNRRAVLCRKFKSQLGVDWGSLV